MIRNWKPVVFAADCDEDGSCPNCRVDFTECPCPGPPEDEQQFEYRVQDGVMLARLKPVI